MQPDCNYKTPMADPPTDPIFPTSSHMQVIDAPKDLPPHIFDGVTGASENPGPDWAVCIYTGLLACNGALSISAPRRSMQTKV